MRSTLSRLFVSVFLLACLLPQSVAASLSLCGGALWCDECPKIGTSQHTTSQVCIATTYTGNYTQRNCDESPECQSCCTPIPARTNVSAFVFHAGYIPFAASCPINPSNKRANGRTVIARTWVRNFRSYRPPTLRGSPILDLAPSNQ
jgi:hypothetical protein